MCRGDKNMVWDDLFPWFFAQAWMKSILEYCEIVDQRNKITQAWYKEIKRFLQVVRFESDMLRRFGMNTSLMEL